MCTIISSVMPSCTVLECECVCVDLKVRTYNFCLSFGIVFVFCLHCAHSALFFPLFFIAFIVNFCCLSVRWSFVFNFFFCSIFLNFKTNQLDQHAIVIKLQCNRTDIWLSLDISVFFLFYSWQNCHFPNRDRLCFYCSLSWMLWEIEFHLNCSIVLTNCSHQFSYFTMVTHTIMYDPLFVCRIK